MLRRTIVILSLAAAVFGLSATAAFALDCATVSRPAPAAGPPLLVVPDGPTIWVIQGDWWYISFDGVFADGIWDKIPPGTAVSVLGLSADEAAALGLPAGTVH